MWPSFFYSEALCTSLARIKMEWKYEASHNSAWPLSSDMCSWRRPRWHFHKFMQIFVKLRTSITHRRMSRLASPRGFPNFNDLFRTQKMRNMKKLFFLIPTSIGFMWGAIPMKWGNLLDLMNTVGWRHFQFTISFTMSYSSFPCYILLQK